MPPVLGCCGDIEVSGGDSRCVPMVQALVASAWPAQSIRTSVHPFKLCIMGLCQQRLYFLPRPDMLMRHSDRAYLRRCERKQQREMEGKASFWKHENFWNINLVNNSLPTEFHWTTDVNHVTDGIVFQSVSKTQGSTFSAPASLFLIQHNNAPAKDRAFNNCKSRKK